MMKALEKRVRTCRLLRKMHMNQVYGKQLGLLSRSKELDEFSGRTYVKTKEEMRETFG